ncbi:chromosomal replication initiator protein DnaA [Fructobacillus fructosus]|uniref:Chromosomal replication initiator protein DnaA n=1 Tax=Fructobacillus fructosus TaxID=1631 RepID=A0ABN9YPW5_9LACO|nr:chromosomal replication initiator protein DnaA [Fructobacillus fructosus]MBD9365445.1 chromosomal replication initiator protein DnaA [Leuconostoc mesenteroides]MBC9118781.1 chromosomal replication initiator protein DnaA [Fructobacillus fructosus]MCK8637854.1 chromosomal replication initiator protein DnaA [Fructobacillus fructosus]CAK1230288.1 Chromosomal replication initiation ATPase DnaA (DnaA) [Fructobacillus fructosus]CAK1233607.1 Chromosomal replication initiation ATPase DnaA (DnaA) [Fr
MADTLSPNELWDKLNLKLYQDLGPLSFDAFVAPLKPIGIEDKRFLLAVPEEFADKIIDQWNQEISMKFVEFVSNETGTFIRPEFQRSAVTQTQLADGPQTSLTTPAPSEEHIPFSQDAGLNPDFTFEKFVIGSGNENARAIAQAVAEGPGKVYNPYLIYGGVGLGKTHLMQAIGNHYAKTNPNARIKYATAEDFLNDFTNSLRKGNETNATALFKKTYRSLDMLLVDDIQFWAGKPQVQEEFFNTFNALTKANKQIVMTSDRYPNDIPDLQDRLKSRFEQGITSDIQKPDVQTKVGILRNMQEKNELDIPNDVLQLIGESIDGNVRTLEGAFHSFEAKIRFQNKPATIETAKIILEEINANKKPVITVERIQEVVADYFMQTVDDMKSSRRQSDIVGARHVAIYLTRTMTDMSLPQIGKAFGNRDHSSISHAFTKIEEQIEKDTRMKEMVQSLAEEISDGQ